MADSSLVGKEGYALEGAGEESAGEGAEEPTVTAMAIMLDNGVMLTLDIDSGEKRLLELGYTQTLQRDLTAFELFAVGFACIGLFVGIVPYYGSAFSNGGPVAVVWYWWIVGLFSTLMIASLAEIASSYPLAGTMYFWAAHLAPASHRALVAWITGWLEFMGSAIGAGATILASIGIIADIVRVSSSTYNPAASTEASLGGAAPAPVGAWYTPWDPSAAATFGLSVALTAIVAALCCCRVKALGVFLAATAVIQMLVAVAIMFCVPFVAPTTQPASFVFGTYLDNWAGSAPNAAYAVVLAFLLPQYSQYAGDSAAHVAEETKRSDVASPLAMLAAQLAVVLLGWGVLVAMTFSIQSVDNLASEDTITGGGEAFAQILFDVFSARYGSGTGAAVFLGLIWLSFFCCSVGQAMISARVAYALARDGGLPFSSAFSQVDSRRVPVAATLLVCGVAVLSMVPILFSQATYFAVASMSTIAWFASYLAPIYYRLVTPEDSFVPGPFYMAKLIGVAGGKVVHLLGLLYALYTICVFLIPTTFPVEVSTFNYAPIGMAILMIVILGWWAIDGRKWFEGPIVKDETDPNCVPYSQ